MRAFSFVIAFLVAARAAQAEFWDADLKRAKTWTPRSGYRGQGTLSSANFQLNRHLSARQGLALKDCEDYTIHGVRHVLRTLFQYASSELKELYSHHDGRRGVYTSMSEMESHWAQVGHSPDERVRDAHCHEAVMWFVHHLTTQSQAEVAERLVLPKLPLRDHRVPKGSRGDSDAAGKFYDEKVTCQACHVGGIDNLGVPEVAPADEKARKRRCYTNYKELYNISCGPCDGIAGIYSGDDDKYFTPTDCIVVGSPEDIPDGDRVKVALPAQFSVDVVGGSDRFGRTTNPIHDQLPGPVAKLYGQIYGKWYMDAKPGADLWLLRHDTTYASVTENGFPIPFIKPHVSEIHAQTAKQRTNNATGPMVSLIQGMPTFIPGGCTCIPDPVGVPDITAASASGMANMQYMGRIKIPKLEYLNTPIELDHWANWFFHIFMDVNKSVPHYGKAPSRLASAYAGTAVYANWVMEDPKIKDPDVWVRGIPTNPMIVGPDRGKFCLNAKKIDSCANVSQATFPPPGEPAGIHPRQWDRQEVGEHSAHPFFPVQQAIQGLEQRLKEFKAISTARQIYV